MEYLFVDTSYAVFYRYYAIYSWYKRAHPDEKLNAETILENKMFMDKYDKMFLNMVPMLAKKYKVKPENIIFALDCRSENIWRQPLYPSYKDRRENVNFNGGIFTHTLEVLMEQLVLAYRCKVIEHDRLEADDVLALCTKILSYKRAVIITNDNDYVQLYKYPGVEIYNLGGQALKSRIKNVDTYLMLKIILGDKSDNIPAIGKKIGTKTAEKMIADEAYFHKVLEKEEVREGFVRNKTLIDFDCIPVRFYDDVKKILKDKNLI